VADVPRLFFLRDVAFQTGLKLGPALLLGTHIGLVARSRAGAPTQVGVGAHATIALVVFVEQVGIDACATKLFVRFLYVFLIVRTIRIRSLCSRDRPRQASEDQQ